MKILRYILLMMAGLFVSCDFNHLHYETSLLVLVRIDVDWGKTHLNPNGVSAFVYDSQGRLYNKFLSSNPNVIFVKLPEGDYTIIVHNDEISYLGGVELSGMDTLSTAYIRATERKDSPSFDVSGVPVKFVNEPSDVASYTLRDVEVDEADVKYHYYKPDLMDYEQQVTDVYTIAPLNMVHLARVIARIPGLDNALGAPTAVLRGMSGGYSFDRETTSEESVMEEFKINTRVSRASIDGNDVIYVDYNTFGMHLENTEDKSYFLDIRFNLVDGSYKDYHIEVTDKIRTETTRTQNIHIMELELEALPEVEGGGDPDGSGDGQFDPSIDDWIDVEIELPM